MTVPKTAVITGATSGIGLETARALAGRGWKLLCIGRNPARCDAADRNLRAGLPDTDLSWFAADLLPLREVRRVAGELRTHLERHCGGTLDALILNAGGVRSWHMTTEDGYEQQFALNHLSGFLLTHRLLPLLQRAGGRILLTGSRSHRGGRMHWDDIMLRHRYHPLTAYRQSKLCNLLFALGLNDRFASSGIRACVVDPGLVNTEIGSKETGGLVRAFWSVRRRAGTHPSVPARTFVSLLERQHPPEGLYYGREKQRRYSHRVTGTDADRLFALSERLCGIRYDQEALV